MNTKKNVFEFDKPSINEAFLTRMKTGEKNLKDELANLGARNIQLAINKGRSWAIEHGEYTELLRLHEFTDGYFVHLEHPGGRGESLVAEIKKDIFCAAKDLNPKDEVVNMKEVEQFFIDLDTQEFLPNNPAYAVELWLRGASEVFSEMDS